MSGVRRGAIYIAAAAVIWYVCILAFWALRPLDDAVPVGVDYTLTPPAFVSVSVDCNSLFDGAARGTSVLPVLKAQPPSAPPLGYQRRPCGLVQRQARVLFWVDTIAFAAVLACCGWLLLRRSRAKVDSRTTANARFDLPAS